jgi:hypothetical protein
MHLRSRGEFSAFFMNGGAVSDHGGCRQTLRPGVGSRGARGAQALLESLEDAGLLGFFLLSEQTHGRGDRLVRGRKPAALRLCLGEMLAALEARVLAQATEGATNFQLIILALMDPPPGSAGKPYLQMCKRKRPLMF